MASTTIMKSIGILIASFIFGMVLLYIVFTGTKEKRKQQLDIILSYTIQFVLYIWLGKIIASLDLFIQDPIAVLAYPGDSTAFYLATGFTLLHIFIQHKRGKINEELLMEGFVPVFFATSFFYGFLQITVEDHSFQLYFVWIVILCITTLLLYQHHWSWQRSSIFMMIWSMGAFAISLNKGYVVILGFLLHPIYFIVLMLFFGTYTWMKRKAEVKEMV